ncbi:MAG TPA: hypothetical protein VFN15_03150, partial [Solirubrobacterales bacterium]|nr:hypothetical protein [Solirubrobacterales bacterium]
EDFGGIKDGVGLIVEVAGEPVDATALEVRSSAAGWDAEIYTSAGEPADDLEAWGPPAGTITDGGTRASTELGGEPVKSVLIWITKLPESEEQPGRFQLQVSDVRVLS